jgi:HEAT repeat protein
MGSSRVTAQGQTYLIELGPPIAQAVVPRVQDPDPDIREALIDVLGVIGDQSTLPVLQAAAKDADASVAAAAKRAAARLARP